MKAKDNSLKADLATLLRAAIATALFAVLAAGAALLVFVEVRTKGNVTENGVVEIAQVVLLALSALMFIWQAVTDKAHRFAVFAIAMFVACMAIRELDAVFDVLLFHGAWALVCAIPLLAFTAVACKAFRPLVHQLAKFTKTPQFAILAAGIILTLFFSRIVGMKKIWLELFRSRGLEQDIYTMRHVKNAVEESFELACYALIFFSSSIPRLLGGANSKPDDTNGDEQPIS